MEQRWWKDREGYWATWLDPDDTEPFSIDWSNWLSNISDTISTYAIDDQNVTISGDSQSSGVISFKASAPTSKYGYATFKITTTTNEYVKSLTVRFYKREG